MVVYSGGLIQAVPDNLVLDPEVVKKCITKLKTVYPEYREFYGLLEDSICLGDAQVYVPTN
jgi:hypothetical protein